MIGAFHSPQVKAKARHSLVATRVEVIGELPENDRRTIIASRAAALKVVPDLDQADNAVQEQILSKVPQDARNRFIATWEKVRKDSAG